MKNKPSDEGMMDESYGSKPDVKPPDDTGDKPTGDKESVDKENAEEADILIDKKKLDPGAKVGDVCSFKIVKDFGDEVSLQWVKDGASKPSETPTDNTEAELSALDEKGTQ